MNDKTMVKYDDAVEMVKTNKLFTEYTYEVCNEVGIRSMEKFLLLLMVGISNGRYCNVVLRV